MITHATHTLPADLLGAAWLCGADVPRPPAATPRPVAQPRPVATARRSPAAGRAAAVAAASGGRVAVAADLAPAAADGEQGRAGGDPSPVAILRDLVEAEAAGGGDLVGRRFSRAIPPRGEWVPHAIEQPAAAPDEVPEGGAAMAFLRVQVRDLVADLGHVRREQAALRAAVQGLEAAVRELQRPAIATAPGESPACRPG
jgi:hypothetical protein